MEVPVKADSMSSWSRGPQACTATGRRLALLLAQCLCCCGSAHAQLQKDQQPCDYPVRRDDSQLPGASFRPITGATPSPGTQMCSVDQVCDAMRATLSEVVQTSGCIALRSMAQDSPNNSVAIAAAGDVAAKCRVGEYCDGSGGITREVPRGLDYFSRWDPTCRGSCNGCGACVMCSVDQVCAAMRAAPSESVVQKHGCNALREHACYNPADQAAIRAVGGLELVVAAIERFEDVVCEDDDKFCRDYSSSVPRTCQRALNCIDPPPFLLAALLCALAVAALIQRLSGRASRRRRGEPICSLADVRHSVLLNLGCWALLLVWILATTGAYKSWGRYRPDKWGPQVASIFAGAIFVAGRKTPSLPAEIWFVLLATGALFSGATFIVTMAVIMAVKKVWVSADAVVGVVCAGAAALLLAFLRDARATGKSADDSPNTAAAVAVAPTTQTNNPTASAAVEPLRPVQPVDTAKSRDQPLVAVAAVASVAGSTDAGGAANTGPRRQVEALLTRLAAGDGNLTFERGEIIDVVSDEPGDGWRTGVCGGRSGVFPANCKRI